MNVNKIGAEIASLMRLMKASPLYAESVRQYPIATEYKNICYSIIKDYKKLSNAIGFMNPGAKTLIESDMEDDRVHYISEVVLLMSLVTEDDCKDILESLKKYID
jgi:dihydroorotate dehydrogenase